ncbi:MAG: hypothetical protein K2K57_13650 [Oscillospiraceae bacterium]|nr:hypothetical protein [Oscillospiraceae bacterium]
MSFVLGLLIILLAMLVVGVSINIITGIILGVVILVNTLLLIFFVGCVIVLAGSKQKSAVFSRIEKRTAEGDGQKKAKFDRACYMVEGREYPNAFPCEIVLKDRLYSSDREVTVWLCEKQGVVFDRNAFAAAVVGFFFFAAVCLGIAVMLISI